MTRHKMDWDCARNGCFNVKKRLKFEAFVGCFPGKINFGDVDGIVEIAGHGLVLEWKETPRKLQRGQELMWQNLTRGKVLTVMVVAGDAADMSVTHLSTFWNGKQSGWVEATIEDLRSDINKWAAWATSNPWCRSS
jgi:hypothetical protein